MPDFRHRLTRSQQRIYDRSNATSSIPVRVSPRLARAVGLLPMALSGESWSRVEKVEKVTKVAQVICDELCSGLRVPGLRVKVKGVRPVRRTDEYHGLYVSRGQTGEITVWMYTAKREQVVAPKTLLRTLVHEVAHHLDYTLLNLEDSFHTDGFFKRESSLVSQLLSSQGAPSQGGSAPAGLRWSGMWERKWHTKQSGAGVARAEPATLAANRPPRPLGGGRRRRSGGPG